jgi:hypothetical protein
VNKGNKIENVEELHFENVHLNGELL